MLIVYYLVGPIQRINSNDEGDQNTYFFLTVISSGPIEAKHLTTPAKRSKPTESERHLYNLLQPFDEIYQEYSCVDYSISVGRLRKSMLDNQGTGTVRPRQAVPECLEMLEETSAETGYFNSTLSCYTLLDAYQHLGWNGVNSYYSFSEKHATYKFQKGSEHHTIYVQSLFEGLKAKSPKKDHAALEELKVYVTVHIE